MIPREVRERIERLFTTIRPGSDEDTAGFALGQVLVILDEHDAAYRAERAADVEAAAGGQQY